MNPHFIHETRVYQILSECGIGVPHYGVINDQQTQLPFNEGDEVVVKGLGDDLWHKSDEGALFFCRFEQNEMLKLHQQIKERLGNRYPLIETLVCQKVPFKKLSNLPTEGFVSLQIDDACGVIISVGLGGIYTEAWAGELKAGIMMWPRDLMSPDQAFLEFKEHLIGKIWLGNLRQGEALSDEKKMRDFIDSLWKLAERVERDNIKLLEMNPVVLDQQGKPVAIDGVGLIDANPYKRVAGQVSAQAILNPTKVAIAGVSEKKGSFGTMILQNLIKSKIDNKNIKVIKPGIEQFMGIECCNDVSALKDNPVDVLILALPAPITVETLLSLCQQGKGAEVVYLVAGGVGDGADKDGYGKKVKELLSSRREKGLWTPSIIGPNSLGIVLSNLQLSTLFINETRLPINYAPQGNIGFVSQSGAFFITRISNDDELSIKYGHCIGNQMDIKISDFMDIYAQDKDIDVVACYIEGFDRGDAIRFSKKAQELTRKGIKVVLYKGGRSTAGMKAAAGHTGAMAGNYQLQKKLFLQAGVIVTESFAQFSSCLKWYSAYPNFKKADCVAVISNAGFETVGSADHLGEERSLKRANKLLVLSDKLKEELNQVIEKNHLTGLVNAANPFDITPAAADAAYLAGTRVFAKSEADCVFTCIVPLSEKLAAFESEKVQEIVNQYKELAQLKPLGIVVDSGKLYDQYRTAFQHAGIPTYSSIEQAFLALT